jgi:hypothetical protein
MLAPNSHPEAGLRALRASKPVGSNNRHMGSDQAIPAGIPGNTHPIRHYSVLNSSAIEPCFAINVSLATMCALICC